MAEISPFAVVERGAELAEDVRIGPFSYVGPEVRIGPGCILENNATVTGKTTLGARNHIFPMAVVGARPDDEGVPGRCPLSGQCALDQANTVREHVVIYGGYEQATRIGSDNLIMIGCQIGPGATLGNHEILANCTHVLAGAVLEDYVRTSAFPVVDARVRVGAYSFIAGYARIDQDAPPFAMLQGKPFRVRGVNTHNLKRCGFGQDDIRALKHAFRELYNGVDGRANRAVLERMLADAGLPPPVRRLAEAIEHGLGGGGRQDG